MTIGTTSLGTSVAHEEPKKELALCIQSLEAMQWIKGVIYEEKTDADDLFRLSSAQMLTSGKEFVDPVSVYGLFPAKDCD